MTPTIAGIIALAVPLLLFALLFLRRHGAVFLFFVVLSAVGIGYLFTTGAVDDIGKQALELSDKVLAEKDAGPAPAAPETAPAPATP